MAKYVFTNVPPAAEIKKRCYEDFGARGAARKKRRKSLPKTLPGTVHAQMIKCGRETCRCAQGQLHGPYFYRFWREAGKLHKAYIKRSDVAIVKDQCEADRARRIKERQQRQRAERRGRQQYRKLAALIKELQKSGVWE